MTRINTNVQSLIATNALSANKDALNTSLERLSTGLRINSGKDDPAGLIASQNLRAEQSALSAAISNADRADQVVNIAEGGLEEITGLLNQVQGLVTQSANTAGVSKEELTANQLQIDSILQTIDRVASATSFQGLKLLNGDLDYNTTAVASTVGAYHVNGAKLDAGAQRKVNVLVTQSAQVGGYLLSFGASQLKLTGSNPQFVLEIGGAQGTRELTFSSSTSIADIADAINSFTPVTGVRANTSGTTGIRLESSGYGSDEFVSIRISDAGGITGSNVGIYGLQAHNAAAADTAAKTTFATAVNRVTDEGQDVQATINGIKATTHGTVAKVSTDFLDVDVDLKYDTDPAASANAAKLGSLDAFTITGGGANFQMASHVDIAGKVSLGIPTVAARDLGGNNYTDAQGNTTTHFLKDLGTGQTLNVVNGDLSGAQATIEAAISQVSTLRGRLGAFQSNTIGATTRSLNISLENTTAAESVIRDTDFASETASLTRAQILVSSSTQILGIANQQPQSALQLLG